jgi:hypothetical protein
MLPKSALSGSGSHEQNTYEVAHSPANPTTHGALSELRGNNLVELRMNANSEVT